MFYFVSPKIYPLFPNSIGKLTFLLDFEHEVLSKLKSPDFTGYVSFTLSAFAGGDGIFEEKYKVNFEAGKADTEPKVFSIASCDFGYVEISFTAEHPIFHNSYAGGGYALLEKSNGDFITVNTDAKFSQYRIIEQIKTWKKFTLVHTAIVNQTDVGANNSFLLVNPYESAIVVQIANSFGNMLKIKVPSHSSVICELAPLSNGMTIFDVVVTSNNRIIAYEVKYHRDLSSINNIDHLDVYSGIPTSKYFSGLSDIKFIVRSIARKFFGRNF